MIGCFLRMNRNSDSAISVSRDRPRVGPEGSKRRRGCLCLRGLQREAKDDLKLKVGECGAGEM